MGIKLPKIKIGTFLRKTVAPIIPGGKQVAEAINTGIKAVKGKTSAGQSVVPATTSTIQQINEDEKRRKITQYALIGAGILLLVLLLRRR